MHKNFRRCRICARYFRMNPKNEGPRPCAGDSGTSRIRFTRSQRGRAAQGTRTSGQESPHALRHYDSVDDGPGAGDDASGVAVVLETLRALKAGPPLDRDVIVLFDDGEENGFHGSRLFVDEHPWAKEIGVVLNFDARGNSGPSIMFETSEGNGWLIHQYAQAAPHPLATSLSMDVYKIMPNNTDMTVFKQAGMGGLNFAFGAGIAYYHTPEDTPVNLDPRTLQHQGENALAMTRRLGRLDLDNPKRDDVIYTSILSRVVVSYAKVWVLPLALAATGLFLIVVAISVRTGLMRLADLVAGRRRALRGDLGVSPGRWHSIPRGNFLVRSPRSLQQCPHSLAEVRRDDHDRVCAGHSDCDPGSRALVGRIIDH